MYEEILRKLKTMEAELERLRAFDVGAGGGGGGGASAFTDLTDVPASYTGQAGKFPKVKATENGLEFATLAGGGDVLGPATSTDGHLAVWDGTDNKTLKDGGAVPAGGSGETDVLMAQVFS